MKLSGSRPISASRETVWLALLDAEILKSSIPGCTEISGNPTDGFEATVVQKVGPVKATFKGAVQLSNKSEHQSLTLEGAGKGGAAGYAKGDATVHLSDLPEGGTLLEYDVQARVGGKLAQLGSRIIDGFAKKMADQFFERFQDAVDGPDAAQNEPDENQEKKGWLKRAFSS